MDGASSPDTAFDRAYQAADQQHRLRHAKVGCVLAMTLMPAGSVLDAIVYPAHLAPFLWVRLATTAAVGLVFAALFTQRGQRHLTWLGSLWALIPGLAISWMIYVSEGEASPYYAGLNLVILAACLLMPYTLAEAATFCALVLASYLTAGLAHPAAGQQWQTFGNNLYFITLTSIIAVTACHYYHLRRIEDFRLRYTLDQRNRQLAEMDRLKTEFVANISHELRTPLTLILAPVDRLLQREAELDPNLQQVLHTIRHHGLRLLKLIDDLLETVRLDAREPTSPPERRKIDLARYVRGLADSVRGLAQTKRITLEHHGPQQGLIVEGDPTSLEKAFLNLLTNAVKFTPDDGRITLTLTGTDTAVQVTIADTGVGIPAEHLATIFDRFRQVDGSSTREHHGLGLGLALVKEWIERHSGHIEAHSTPGSGTAFTVTLPRAQASPHDTLVENPQHSDDPEPRIRPGGDPATATPRQEPAPPSPNRPPSDHPHHPQHQNEREDQPQPQHQNDRPRVLVVDDEPDMRTFLVQMLEPEYAVLSAGDGQRALELASTHQPDVMVLDLMLPGMDGLAVCQQLRQRAALADLGVIVLTARGDERSKIQVLQAGADDLMTKPFSSVEVKTRLANLLRRRQLQRDLRTRNHELESTLAALRSTRSQLVHSEKMNALGMLAAGLLHEINNPLNYTLTALQLAQQDADRLAEPVRETLDDIGEGMGRIRDIVSDLRAFAHPDDLDTRTAFRVREAVDGALRLVDHQRGKTRIDADVPEDLSAHGSKSHITQVLVNLVANALRAVEQADDGRTPRVSIHAHAEHEVVLIRVVDNGVGVPAEQKQRVFDPFYTTREVGDGMGLGLSICHTIVAEHDGSIQLQSTEGSGTIVTVRLPL